MAGTEVSYNNVKLVNVLTRSFNEEDTYDPSGTDVIGRKYTISVVAHFHLPLGPVGVTPTTGANAVDQHRQLRDALLIPRKTFLMTTEGGSVLLGATAFDDINNGPKPISCEITNIHGTQTLRVEYRIEITKTGCIGTPNPVINNRWSMADDIGPDWITTRVLRGQLRVSRLNLNPQKYRDFVVPPLSLGFKREHMRFVSSPDGLVLDYEITDRRIFNAPPPETIEWQGTHTVSTGDGVTVHSQLVLNLTGPPNGSKQKMFAVAAQIVEAKLHVTRDQLESGGFLIESASFVDHLRDNRIEVQMHILHTDNTSVFFGVLGQDLGTPIDLPNYDRLVSPQATETDLPSIKGLFICRLQDPCDGGGAKIPSAGTAGGSNYGRNRGQEDIQIDSGTGSMPVYAPDYASDHLTKIYTFYEVESSYYCNTLLAAMPFAKSEVGEDTQTEAIVTLGRGYARRLITVKAERANQWPAIPGPDDFADLGSTVRLLRWKFGDAGVRTVADGRTKLYSATIILLYALPKLPGVGEYTSFPLPWQGSGDAGFSGSTNVPSQMFRG